MKNGKRVFRYGGLCICMGLSGCLLVVIHAGSSPGLILGFASMVVAILCLSALSLFLWAGRPTDQEFRPGIQKDAYGDDPEGGRSAALDSLSRSLEAFVTESRIFRSRLDDRIDDIEAEFEKLKNVQQGSFLQGDIRELKPSPTLTDNKADHKAIPIEATKRSADEIFRTWWLSNDRKINQLMGNNSEGPLIFNCIERKLSDAMIEFGSAGRFMGSNLLSISLKEAGFSGHMILIPILYFPVPYEHFRFFEGERDRPAAIVKPALIRVENSNEDAKLVARGVLG